MKTRGSRSTQGLVWIMDTNNIINLSVYLTSQCYTNYPSRRLQNMKNNHFPLHTFLRFSLLKYLRGLLDLIVGFHWSARGDLEPSYACMNFFPPVNSVNWWQTAFEWRRVQSLVGFSLYTTSTDHSTTGMSSVAYVMQELWSTGNWHLHHDNASAHSSHLIQTFWQKTRLLWFSRLLMLLI